MVHPLNHRERQAHYAENPDMRAYRVAFALDRENQPGDPDARERVVVYRAVDALARASQQRSAK